MKLFGIITVTWTIEMMSFAMKNSHESKVVADFIKCYSAGLLAFLLLWNEKIRALAFGKYNTMKSEVDDVDNDEV